MADEAKSLSRSPRPGAPGARPPAGPPASAELRVHRRVVEQVEVVQAAEAMHVVGREGQPVVVPGVAEGAARRHQQVAEEVGEPPSGRGSASPGRRSAGRRRAAGRACARGTRPSRSRPVQSASTSVPWRRSLMPTLRRTAARASGRVSGSRASGRPAGARRAPAAPRGAGAQGDRVAHEVGPAVRVRRPALRLVQRAARDQTAHRVPDQDDVLHRHRPRRHQRARAAGRARARSRRCAARCCTAGTPGSARGRAQQAAVGVVRAVVPLRLYRQQSSDSVSPCRKTTIRPVAPGTRPQRRGSSGTRGRRRARSCPAPGPARPLAARSPCAPLRIAERHPPARSSSRSRPPARRRPRVPATRGARPRAPTARCRSSARRSRRARPAPGGRRADRAEGPVGDALVQLGPASCFRAASPGPARRCRAPRPPACVPLARTRSRTRA